MCLSDKDACIRSKHLQKTEAQKAGVAVKYADFISAEEKDLRLEYDTKLHLM